MSFALKYTTFKDANIPLEHFRAEKKMRHHRKTFMLVLLGVAAAALPFFFLYVLISPQGYKFGQTPQSNDVSFIEQYASSPVPTPVMPNYLTAR